MAKGAVGLLKKLTEAHGVPGFEGEVREIFVDELGSEGALETDRNGSVLCRLEGSGPRVLLEGHMDEVGFRIQSILAGGMLRLVPVGGWWAHVLLAQQLTVRTAEGRKVHGVVGSKPPHFLPEAERSRVMSIEDMFVDVGATSREEVEELGIRLGDPVAPRTQFEPLSFGNRFVAKAFDNRVGMAGVIEAGKRLAKRKWVNELILAGAVQEEVGLRGAQTLSALVRPDVAIILEGTPADDTPGFDRTSSQGSLGKGVQIRLHDPSAIMHPGLAALAIEVAVEKKIPHQIAVRQSGGTDAGRIHLSGEGVPCVVLGVPARYIHSHNSVIDLGDYEAMVDLSVALLSKLNAKVVEKLVTYV